MDLYSVASFLNDFRVIALIIVIIIAFTSKPFTNKRLNLLLAYLIFAVVSNIVLISIRGNGNNIFVSYLMTPVHLILYSFLLTPETADKRFKSGVLGIILIGLLIILSEALFLQGGTNNFNSLSSSYTSLTLGSLAIYGLIRLRYDPSIYNLSKEPLFWIFVAIAIENIGTLISTAFYRFFQLNDNETLIKVAFLSLIVDYIGTVLYCIGFLKAKKKKPDSNPKLAT